MKSDKKMFKGFSNLQASTEKSLALLYRYEIESPMTTSNTETAADVGTDSAGQP